MNLLADEGVDRPIVEALRREGYTVLYVAEMSPGLSDTAVLAQAREVHALLLTADKDFGVLIFQQHQLTTGVILLRLAGLKPQEKARRVVRVLATYGRKMPKAFTVITPQHVRIRPLRMGSSSKRNSL